MYTDIISYHYQQTRHLNGWHNITQHAISAKIDDEVYEQLEDERKASGLKRNRIINLAIRWYITELDEARRKKIAGEKG